MAKEFSADLLGKKDTQPVVKAGNDVEAAANGNATSTDAMGASASSKSSKASVVKDNENDSWSETHEGTTYNYARYAMNMQNLATTGIRVDSKGNSVAYDDPTNSLLSENGETKMTVAKNDPEAGIYHRDNYLVKNPVSLDNDKDHPAFNDLVEASSKGTQIDYVEGTLQNPNSCHEIDQSTLFIENTTSQEDIHQGNVGDCYFLAALLQVIHYDPSKIVNMMKLLGDDVTTTFYYKNGKKWSPVKIQTKLGLIARDNVYGDNTAGMYFMGSSTRISYDPVKAQWYSSIDNNTLKINKVRFHEAALWVNCIEQAFSLFSQKYGQYGYSSSDENLENQATERYSRIDGGFSSYCINMFYGDQGQEAGFVQTSDPEAGQNEVEANKEMISELLTLAQTQDGKAEFDTHIMAATTDETAVSRLNTYTDMLKVELEEAIKASPEDEELASAMTTLNYIQKQISHYFETETPKGREGTSSAEQLKIREELDRVSLTLEQNKSFQSKSLPSYDKFRTTLATVVEFYENDPSATNGANIYIYSGHAYNVDRVTFRDAEGKDINKCSLKEVLSRVDLKQSSLVLENPHGTTKATMHKKEERNAQGDFETSLELFLANVMYVTVATVSHSSDKKN